MTILAPSQKANEARGRSHKTAVDWAILAMRVISRFLKRSFLFIGDGGFACIALGHACIKQKVTLLSRLRLDAALYHFAPSPVKGQLGRHRVKGDRLLSLKKLASDLTQAWTEVTVNWYDGESKTVRILTGVCLWYSSFRSFNFYLIFYCQNAELTFKFRPIRAYYDKTNQHSPSSCKQTRQYA